MRLIVLILVLVVFGTGSVAAQGACVWEAKNAPALLNLKLGMSAQEAQNAVGRALKIKIKNKGERTFFQNFITKPAPPALNGVRALYLRFFDGRLYQIEIFYENREEWRTLQSFTQNLAARMDSPPFWTIKNGRSEIKCSEISIVADFVLNPRVEITNEIVRARVEELRKKS